MFRGANRYGNRYFTVLAKANDAGGPRLGLAVSKRVSASAVARNRIKRLVRESFRTEARSLTPQDLVVIAKPAAAKASNRQLTEALRREWQRIQASSAESSER